MKTEFEKHEIIIKASRKDIWKTVSDFENYHNWNTLVPNGQGTLKEGSSLTIGLKLKDEIKLGRCRVNKVVPEHYFILSRQLFFKWLLYLEHAFIIENINHVNVFSQTIHISGILKPLILKKFKPVWVRFHDMNKDLKSYLNKKQ